MAELLTIRELDKLKPKTQKSNLNVKKRKTTRKKTSDEAKKAKKHEEEIARNADIVFGLDNGATGTIAAIIASNPSEVFFRLTPAIYEKDYQKSSQQKIARIDWISLKKWFEDTIHECKEILSKKEIKACVLLERPMINAERFKQSKNAARAFEATLIVLEMLGLKDRYIVVDSKRWQHFFFGKNTVQLDLKKSSADLGVKFIKSLKNLKDKEEIIKTIQSHGDADGLMIAKYGFDKLR